MSDKTALSTAETVRYICHRTEDAIDVDGHLQEEVWTRAQRSPRFGDHTGQRSLFDTRAAMLWDDQNLYVGFWLEDRDMWGTQKEASPLVRQDNNAGVLLVGRGAYYELAVNPLGATSEMFYIWKEAYQRGDRYDVPEFDLAVHRPEVLGGGSNSDYRAMRWAFSHWRFPGLQVGVQVAGTLNKRDDIDQGWSVELAFPWEGLRRLADAQSLPPAAGDIWRIGLVRRQIIDQRASQRQVSWTWQPLIESNMHVPKTHLEMEFSRVPPGELGSNPA